MMKALRAANSRFIYKGAVAAFQIYEYELVRFVSIACDSGMLPTDKFITIPCVFNFY